MKTLQQTTVLASFLLLGVACSPKYEVKEHGQYNLVIQKGGKTLGFSPTSGVKILEEDGLAFKDLNRNGQLDPYEDWRLPSDKRAEDLASQLSIEEIAGLMLYSMHQTIPGNTKPGIFAIATYNDTTLEASGLPMSALTDQQKKFLKEDHLRHILVTQVASPRIAAEWSNNVQSFVEGLDHGIPANNSSDPRHNATAKAEYDYGNGGKISMWPTPLGMAATFDPDIVKEFGRVASFEYRALGLTTALSPQIDIATEPRWSRVNGTFGEEPKLVADMARAYCDGFQSCSPDKETEDGWGYESVNAMCKHWPGGGAGESGRDAHYGYGKYAVFPGGNLEKCLYPFLEGAFKLDGKTQKASAVMPYYTISYGQDPSGNNVGNSFSKYIITNLLREKYGYDGVVCTDWMITADEKGVGLFTGKCWGVENLTVAERHYRCIEAGVDQFGGNNDKVPVLEAYQMGVKEHGEEYMRNRFEQSARRLLMNIFRTGLFENPYLDPEESEKTVGCPEFMKIGYEAQLKSVVLLKNRSNVLPIADSLKKVYVPKMNFPAQRGFYEQAAREDEDAIDSLLLSKYYRVTRDPEEADFAIVKMHTPNSGPGYDIADVEKGGNGYIPISLQYCDYTAVAARPVSLAGGDPYESFTNRSYLGKSVKTDNKCDLDVLLATRKAMGNKPIIAIVEMNKPVMVGEFESKIDAILVTFDCLDMALLDIISGKNEPKGLLPMQFPADMATVERQAEDTPRDMIPYVDEAGNAYDFAFGMNWNGVINDERVKKYK